MKKFVLKLFSLFACVVLFSCSDIFQDKVNGNSSNGANLVLNISNGGKGFARTVTSCSGFDIASLEWNVEIFPVVDGVVSETAIEAENQGTDGTYSYTILTGTYFITVSSEFTDSENVKHTIYGEASDVEIAEDSTTPVAISVGLKKTAEGTGTFGPYEISVPKTILKYSESYSFNVGLKKTTNKKEKADYAWEFADVTSDENNLLLSMEAKTVDSGFYHIIIHYSVDGTDFEEIYASDELVEIGDGGKV
ncbi:MAG: hypothetical protein KBT11_04210 [Treponema sp.]|nr:hypothetical protein [Candidatus Treponema equifaecale]